MECDLSETSKMIEDMRQKQRLHETVDLGKYTKPEFSDDFGDTEASAELQASGTTGYRILRKLGWDAKHALGKAEGKPMNAPISVIQRRKGAGLGT
jgi:hypothetical protein